jgi:hypothetical protein
MPRSSSAIAATNKGNGARKRWNGTTRRSAKLANGLWGESKRKSIRCTAGFLAWRDVHLDSLSFAPPIAGRAHRPDVPSTADASHRRSTPTRRRMPRRRLPFNKRDPLARLARAEDFHARASSMPTRRPTSSGIAPSPACPSSANHTPMPQQRRQNVLRHVDRNRKTDALCR